MTPDLDRRREEKRDQQGDQHGFGDGTEEETSEDGTDDRSSRHGEYEAFVGYSHLTVVPCLVNGFTPRVGRRW